MSPEMAEFLSVNPYLSAIRTRILSQTDSGLNHPVAPRDPEMIRQIVKNIDADPRTWYQLGWASSYVGGYRGCGTSYCLAGWAAQLAGRTATDEEGDVYCLQKDGELGHFFEAGIEA